MGQSDLIEHRGYLADEVKIAAYRAALAEVVEPGDVVLDLGAGTGLLGYLASEAGAKTVVAIDASSMIEVARSVAGDNGYTDRVTHLRAMSTETSLDSLADVIVCDQIGGLVHDAGILTFYADARRRLLAPDGVLVPSAFRIFVAPVTFDDGRKEVDFWSSSPASLDVGSVRRLAANTEWHVTATGKDAVKLSSAAELARFGSDHDDPIAGSATFTVEEAGRFDGFMGWFEAQMSPSVTLTNDPWSPDRFERWCNFYPIDRAVDVQPGDELSVSLDIRPRRDIVSWNIDVALAGQAPQHWRHSTFLAKAGSDLLEGDAVPLTERSELARIVLDHIDGARTPEAIVVALDHLIGAEGTPRFTSRVHLESFVRSLTNLVR